MPEYLVIERDGARLVVDAGEPVDHQCAMAKAAKHASGNRAGRPETSDQYIVIGGDRGRCHARSPATIWGPKGTDSWAFLQCLLLGGAMPHWSVRPGGQIHSLGPFAR